MAIIPQLDADSTTPLYRQLYQSIRDSISGGTLAVGDRLPPTRDLALSLSVNRTTVSAAYELLENEGLIRGHVGRGSFVASTPARETAISFATSRPLESLFPIEEFRAATREVIDDAGASSLLQLGSTSGYAPLRRYLFEDMKSRGIARASDDILVTSGCQQALDLVQRVLAPSDSTVLVEDPTYPGLKNVFERAGLRLVGVPMTETGVDVDRFRRAAATQRPALAVITPNFQNPTGATMPEASRRHVLSTARDTGMTLIESDIYGALRYSGDPVPTIKQMDVAGEVIQLGSFSKVAFPGLRVGWVVGPRAAIARLTEAKQWSDLHTDQLSQAILLRFIESGRLDAHRRRVIETGARQLAAMLDACAVELPPGTSFTRPQGGMNLMVTLPQPLDAAELLPLAQRAGVTYLPGKYFAVSEAEPGALRLSFAGLTPERIREGLAILGSVLRTELQRARITPIEEPVPAMV